MSMEALLGSDDGTEHMLLREAHHRTANAFQIVSGTLARASRDAEDGPARDALRRADLQIQAFALLNDVLHAHGQPGAVCAAAYLKRLAALLVAACLADSAITLDVSASEPQLCPERVCRHYGLIATELVLNAAKHAFVGRSGGTIRIALSEIDEPPGRRLVIADDGIGIPLERLTARRGGLGFVQALALAMNAEIEGRSGSFGTVVELTVPARREWGR